MPWSGSAPSQSFTRTDGTSTGDDTWQQAAAAPRNIEADDHDVHDTDLKDGINACLKKDGGNTATANIPMGGFTLANISAAGARTEPARFSDVQDNKGQYVATVGGTADAITLTPSISIGAYAAGQRFTFVAGGTNTGATTVNVSGLGAKSIVRPDGSNTALSAGDIISGTLVDIGYDGTRFQLLLWRADVVFDTSPLLGGDLDTNGFDIKFDNNKGIRDDSGRPVLIVGKVASAVNYVKVNNNATGGAPLIEVAGDDTNIDLLLAGKGSGAPKIGSNAVLHAGNTASDSARGVIEIAVQSEMEAASDTGRAVVPGRQQYHPGHPKFWGYATVSGGTPTLQASYNLTSITDDGTGLLTATIATDFSSANYAAGVSVVVTGNDFFSCVSGGQAAGSVQFASHDAGTGSGPDDPEAWSFWGFGDQA